MSQPDDLEAAAAELERLLAEATPGPWGASASEREEGRANVTGPMWQRTYKNGRHRGKPFPLPVATDVLLGGACLESDAELIAAARNHLPALLASWRERGRLLREAAQAIETLNHGRPPTEHVNHRYCDLAARLREAAPQD